MASRFWVGGTGTWDASDTTHWAATSGGAGGQSVPGASDTVTFDASSGGGTVTVSHASNTITSLTMSAFTGTLDFATNDNDITMGGFSNNGSGTRTLNMGDGVWTVTNTSNCWLQTGATNLTFNCNGSTLSFTGAGANPNTATLGNFTYNIVSFGANRSGMNITGTVAIATLNVTAPMTIIFGPSTYTITNALNLVGTAANPIGLVCSTVNNQFTLALGAASTGEYCAVREMINTTNSFTFTNSFDLGRNTQTGGGSITGPSGGGGGGGQRVISG